MLIKRYIDVEKNMVWIDELEYVIMDLSSLPKDVKSYMEVDGAFIIHFKNQENNVFSQHIPALETSLKILEEAVVIWEQEREMKFDPDMHKDYREEIKEIERLANEKLGLE